MSTTRNKTIFITGGTGFFGKAFLRCWKNKSPKFKKCFILSRDPRAFLQKHSALIDDLNIEFIKGDVLEAAEIKLNDTIDYVLHAATDATVGSSLSQLDIFYQITKGTEEVLKFAANHGCKKLLFTSSGAVYGHQPHYIDKIPESYLGCPDPLDPDSAYGLGKKFAEHICALYSNHYGFECVIARCFAFVGQDLPLDAHFAIGNFIRDAINGSDISINGDGSPARSYMHQSDLAEWLIQILLEGKNGVAYNVGSDDAISIEELAFLVRDLLHPSGDVIIKANKSSNFRNFYVPDVTLAQSTLGLAVNYNVREALIDTANKIIV